MKEWLRKIRIRKRDLGGNLVQEIRGSRADETFKSSMLDLVQNSNRYFWWGEEPNFDHTETIAIVAVSEGKLIPFFIGDKDLIVEALRQMDQTLEREQTEEAEETAQPILSLTSNIASPHFQQLQKKGFKIAAGFIVEKNQIGIKTTVICPQVTGKAFKDALMAYHFLHEVQFQLREPKDPLIV